MHSILKEIHPVTVVDHAISCNFFNDQETNLVTAGSSKLSIYRLYDVEEDGTKEEDGGAKLEDVKVKRKLEQVASYSLFGNVVNMQVVRLGHNIRDSVLLVFKDAKLSIVEYDPFNHDLKTDSMHFFENEEFKCGLTHNIHQPLVRVDPDQRCACVLIYGRHLVVLPFKHSTGTDIQELPSEREHIRSVLPSYMIDLHTLDQPVSNIADLQYLHGYNEPTLMLLHEPVQTSAGRIAVRQDTYCVSAISLNMTEKVHPIIWTVNNLPFDCQMIQAVQKPIGGVLVFACNSLIYLNQSSPPCGVSLNSMTEASTMFPLKIQDDVVITLAEACCDFISPEELVLSLGGGEIYVLTLLTDGLRSVKSFHFDKAAGSVLASCVCVIENGFVFLGSRLGNSLLLRYTEKQDKPNSETKPGELPLAKKRKTDPSDLDDFEIFGDLSAPTTHSVTTYTFNVSDSLLNIGPISKSAVGEPAFLSVIFQSEWQADLELVCCSGYGKNGALTVLQRSIRPQVVTTFELPGCTNMWTVYSNQKEDEKEHYHAFLILSREDSTMVLNTGDEITEIDNSGFNAQNPTVFAGNLGLDRYIVQVCPMSIRLLEGSKEIQDIQMGSDSPNVTFCSIADPHAVLLMADGSIMYMQLIEDFNGPKLKLIGPDIRLESKITSVCMYKDESGLFQIEAEHKERRPLRARRLTSVGAVLSTVSNIHEAKRSLTIEDEEEMLYGESSALPHPDVQQAQLANIRRRSFAFQGPARTNQDTYWCVICRENGELQIYSLPEFTLVFTCNEFSNAPKVLADSGDVPKKLSAMSKGIEVKEIVMVGVGNKKRRPLLFTIIDQDLVIYECFSYNKHIDSGHLGIRFKRLETHILMRMKEEMKLAEMADVASSEKKKVKIPRLRVVYDVSSYKVGIFVCGMHPYWLFVTSRGIVNGHPMTVDGAVTSFASFNNINCPKGFLYFNKLDELRIAVLPSHLTYDSPWPVRKVPLRMTPYDIAYETEAKVYAVAVAYGENHKKLPRFHTEDREFDTVERESRYIYPQIDRFVIELISPVSWEVIPNSRTVLEEFEHVTSIKVLHLQSELVDTGLKQFVVVGTSFNYGEDLACKGRILVFDVVEVVPEPGQPLTKTKSKCLYNKEQKGPVTAMCASSGYLIAAVGQKIYAYSFKNADLVGVAFVDSQVFTVNLFSLRNIIVAADISRSISLIRFQTNHKSLALVSRDSKPLEAYSSEFFVDGSQIGFVVCDAEKNALIFAYQPEALESFGGQRLLLKADINVGCHVNTMFRIKVAQDEATLSKVPDQRQVTFMPTLDGSICSILPLPEKPYRRLLMLQNKLTECLQHKAGLNPRAFRALNVPLRPLTNAQKNILDGQLLSKYVHLNFTERFEIAKKMGTTAAQILDDMMDMERACTHF
ncbi:cleavage and polyadenylation specificity factor subunit 1-like [Hydractinia symbiolongicarpus]|uniref:cleavage and polyadenylation specificity factor subunit 1-like n=1 Tax=Hydractinia symbiolongicarpus TaxID=13093 RepID=UPI00254E9699|nr:cleavage and polyadenylation specificity factor subunit 1-like [Hydractinia symbiolongicarpus]